MKRMTIFYIKYKNYIWINILWKILLMWEITVDISQVNPLWSGVHQKHHNFLQLIQSIDRKSAIRNDFKMLDFFVANIQISVWRLVRELPFIINWKLLFLIKLTPRRVTFDFYLIFWFFFFHLFVSHAKFIFN